MTQSEEQKPKTPPALARARQLVERSSHDLKLAHDAALAARLPFKSLAKLKRAQREVRDLAHELSECPIMKV